jgi:hypothetical protein
MQSERTCWTTAERIISFVGSCFAKKIGKSKPASAGRHRRHWSLHRSVIIDRGGLKSFDESIVILHHHHRTASAMRPCVVFQRGEHIQSLPDYRCCDKVVLQ